MIKEVTVYSPGNSRSLTCWSNVPYLFVKSLENKGIKVNRVNIYSNKYIRKTVWRFIVGPIVNKFFRGYLYTYEQTWLNKTLINFKIKRAQSKYINSDMNIFISYDYLPAVSSIPNVIFCDWTFEYLLVERLKREPCETELKQIFAQRDIIEKADFVVTLFPDIAEYMRQSYTNKNIFYLGQNVINNVYEECLDEYDIIKVKKDSQILLFIGREGYIEGAKMLVHAFRVLKEKYTNLELHIIGLSTSILGTMPNDVYCYGYLDKTKEQDRACYYELLKKAKIFINPTPIWGGYSSTIESMFFFNPIIISNYKSFVETFSEDISFGYYVNEFSLSCLLERIEALLGLDEDQYSFMCKESHEAVKSFTWDSFVDRFLEMTKSTSESLHMLRKK